MDLVKFIVLTIACVSGFTATSYSLIALKKGWPVSRLFLVEGGFNIITMGIICQVGSIIISFFVNPWWSAFLVLILGYIGYIILTIIFKQYSQILGGLMVIASSFLVPIFVFFNNTPIKDNQDHLHASIKFSNEAAKIVNSGKAFEIIEQREMNYTIELLEKL